MDYKEIADTVKWHAMHSGLNGAESRLMCFAVTSAEYKTSTLQASYSDLADAVGMSPSSVAKSVASLVKKKALQNVQPAAGRMQATYRVLSAQELTAYFRLEELNPKFAEWESLMNDKFYELETEHDDIGANCDECGEDGLCPMHAYHEKMFEQKIEWRERNFWLASNPKPNRVIFTIHGRVLESPEAPPVRQRNAGSGVGAGRTKKPL